MEIICEVDIPNKNPLILSPLKNSNINLKTPYDIKYIPTLYFFMKKTMIKNNINKKKASNNCVGKTGVIYPYCWCCKDPSGKVTAKKELLGLP